MDKIIVMFVLGALIGSALSQSKSTANTTRSTRRSSTTASSQSSTSFSPPTTSLSPAQECARLSVSCDQCVENKNCFYCYSNDTCKLYPEGKMLPSSDDCALSEARWGVCWLNFEALIISLSLIGGVLIITVSCCIYCCCCRNREKKLVAREAKMYDNQRMERKAKQDDRRQERKGRMDDIRKKYGLMKDDSSQQ